MRRRQPRGLSNSIREDSRTKIPCDSYLIRRIAKKNLDLRENLRAIALKLWLFDRFNLKK